MYEKKINQESVISPTNSKILAVITDYIITDLT